MSTPRGTPALSSTEQMRRAFVKRFASLGFALALAVGTLAPAAHAAAEGKTIVLGFSQEPDTFVASEGGLYVTQEVDNLVYSQLVVIDDLMRPIPDLAVDVPTLDNGEAVVCCNGADQHLETTFHLRQDAKWSDGNPLTAEDILFSWKLSLNPVRPAQAGNDPETKYTDHGPKDPHTRVIKMRGQNHARA